MLFVEVQRALDLLLHVVEDRTHGLKDQLRVVCLHRIFLQMLRLGKRHLQILQKLSREVVTPDRNTSLPNAKTISNQQVACVGPDTQNHGALRRPIGIKLLGGHLFGKSLVGNHVVDAHRSQLHQVDVDPLVAVRLQGSENRLLLHRKQANLTIQRIALFDLCSFHLLEVPNHIVQIKGNLLLGFILNNVPDLLDFNRGRLEELRQSTLSRNTHGYPGCAC